MQILRDLLQWLLDRLQGEPTLAIETTREAGPVAAPVVTRPPAVPPPRGDAYYCYSPGCREQDPRPLAQMVWGCRACDLAACQPHTEINAVAVLRDLAQAFKTRIDCANPRHKDFAVGPRCPSCGTPVRRYWNNPAVCITGAPGSGKTINMGVIAGEQLDGRDRIGGMTGHIVVPQADTNQFVTDVVRPLYLDGTLAALTDIGQHDSMLLHFQHPAGGLGRMVPLRDMAGEVWERGVVKAEGEMFEHLTQVARARETILVLNPQGGQGLGKRADPDLTVAVRDLFQLYTSRPELMERPTVEALDGRVRGWLASLRDQGFPGQTHKWARAERHAHTAEAIVELDLTACGRGSRHRFSAWDSLGARKCRRCGRGFAELVEARFGDVPAVEMVRSTLARSHEAMLQTAPLVTQVALFADFLEHEVKVDTKNGKVLHRLALTLAKADLLRDYDRKAARSVLEQMGARPGAPLARWREGIRAVSAHNRDYLLQREPQLVQLAEARFAEVGFFVVSSLGRGVSWHVHGTTHSMTEPNLVPEEDDGLIDLDFGLDEEAPVEGVQFELEQRVAYDTTMQEHAPRPLNVMHPLIWILTESA